jgi:hypothetical protein
MLSHLNHVGFNITKNQLQLVEVVRESSKFCLENVDERVFERVIDFNSDESEIISILQTAFNSLTNITPLNSKNISFSIPFREFKVFEIPFEASLSPKALEEHIKWEFSILFPTLNSDDYVLRNLQLATRENQKKVLIVGLSKYIIQALYKFSIQNKLNLKFIDNSHFAFNSTIRFRENRNVLSVYLCSNYCSIISYLGKEIQSTSQFEVYDNNSIIDSVYDFVENQNIAYDKIHLASSLDVDELRIGLKSKLNISVENANPFDFVPTSESFIQNAYFINLPNSFSAAAGMCYRKI